MAMCRKWMAHTWGRNHRTLRRRSGIRLGSRRLRCWWLRRILQVAFVTLVDLCARVAIHVCKRAWRERVRLVAQPSSVCQRYSVSRDLSWPPSGTEIAVTASTLAGCCRCCFRGRLWRRCWTLLCVDVHLVDLIRCILGWRRLKPRLVLRRWCMSVACRSPTVSRSGCMRLWGDHRLLHVGCLSGCSSKSEVGLLVCSSKQLEGIEITMAGLFTKFMKVGWRTVARTVNHRRGYTIITTEANHLGAVLARVLHGCNLESKFVVRLLSTANMEVGIATCVAARNTCTLGRFADLADLSPTIL